MIRIATVLFALWLPVPANALNVFSCEPEWAALVEELAGDKARITLATTAFQDPHMLQAKPSLIAGARSAELLRRAGNPHIQPGSPGHFLAADYVRRIEIPADIDRSQGDVHPQGNPHIHLHPRNIERVAEALADRLAELDAANASTYRANADDFLRRWSDARERWEQRAQALAGMRLVSHHRSFSYLADWLDLDIVATLEPKPGIPASGAHLSRLLEQLTPAPPAGIIRAPFENEKPAHWLSDRLEIPMIEMAFTVGGSEGAGDLFGLYEETITALESYRQ